MKYALAVVTLVLAACGGGGSNERAIPEPEVRKSSGGVLNVTLTQAPERITVAGKTFVSNVFDGRYIPPVLQLQRGDRLDLTLVNRIGKADVQIDAPQATNLHYHGMTIPPAAPADDVYLHLAPQASYAYRWQVPLDHSQGAHWYHPHAHGKVEPQILSGMSGLLMIGDLVGQHYPAFAGLVQQHLLLKDIVLPGAAADAPNTKTINGVLGGSLRMRPGEMRIWHLGNVGADAFFDFAVQGAQLWEIGRDGNVLLRPRPLASVYLAPGSRSTVVVVAPTQPGRYAVRTLAVATGPQGDPNPEVELAHLNVDGDPQDSTAQQARLRLPADRLDAIPLKPADLKAMPITRKRTIVFSETPDGNTFFLNGRSFDEARDDVVVNLGDVEEWTLRNVAGERHVFHIHQLDFLVTSINHQDIDETGLRDVIDLPWQQGGVPGEVKVIIPFTDPAMVGRFVFHCHIVGHEDAGMMANLVVLPAGQTAMAPARMRTVQALPADDVMSRLRRWAGLAPARLPASASEPWADALCRSGDASVASALGAGGAVAARAEGARSFSVAP